MSCFCSNSQEMQSKLASIWATVGFEWTEASCASTVVNLASETEYDSCIG